MKRNGKPELLAPAGNLEAALVAYKSGADAVYAGLGKFNAREMADNFSFSDMSRLAEYSKSRNKKYYLTLNTLIKEEEIDEVAENLESISQLEPDGVIVADIGILRLIREQFPQLNIHSSTQMGIHNSKGVSLAEKLGVKRVILERQVTLLELTDIIQKAAIEIEVFIHGALCCSLSGVCLFSSWIGGFSGNRGRCKQPCRRRYYLDGPMGKKNGFFFSTQDLYTLDMIHDLIDIGVASLKIEGRLKSAGYVEKVVSAYRIIIDEGSGELGKARGILSNSFGRKWSHGFYFPEEKLILHDSLGVSGQLAGSVKECRPNGFFMDVLRRIHLGDTLRVQPKSGDEGPRITILTMLSGNKRTQTARKGERVFISTTREIPSGGLVYKIEESSRREIPKLEALPLFVPRKMVNLSVLINGETISVTMTNIKGAPKWEQALELEPAKSHPLMKEEVKKIFRATRSTVTTGVIEVSITGDFFLPASVFKAVRRSFWEWAAEEIQKGGEIITVKRNLQEIKNDLNVVPDERFAREEVYYLSAKSRQKIPKNAPIVRNIFEISKETKEALLPHFCPEHRLEELQKAIDEAYKKGIRRFRITSLFHLEMLKKHGNITISTSFPLPVTNSLASRELSSLGVKSVQGWLELEKKALLELKKASPLPLEIYLYGRPFILATRADLSAEGNISDSRGKKFSTHKDRKYGITYVYPEQVFSIPKIKGCRFFLDFSNAVHGEKNTSIFNYDYGLK